MSSQVLQLPRSNVASVSERRDERFWEKYDQQRQWFAYALPAVMALLLALVPILRMKAAIPFAAVLMPLLLWTALRDTERAVYVYCAWCWMDGTIRGISGGGTVISGARDIVLVLILIGWAIQRSRNRITDPVRKPPGALLIGLFVTNCLMELFNPYTMGLFRSLVGLKIHLASIPLFFIGYDVFRRRGQMRSLLVFLALATLVVSAVSIVQYSRGRAWTYDHFPGTKEVISQAFNPTAGSTLSREATFKPPGTTSYGGGTAVFPGMVLPLLFALILLSGKLRFARGMRFAFGVVMLVFIVTFFVNGIRAPLVEAVAGVILCSVLVGGQLRVRALSATALCLVLGVIGYLISVNMTQGGAANRFALLFTDPSQALTRDRTNFFQDLPGLLYHSSMGIGLGSTGAAVGHLGPHYGLGFNPFSESYFGSMILETGIIGALLIAAIAVFFICVGYRATQNVSSVDERLLATSLVGSLAMMFVSFFLIGVLFQPPGSVLFWLFGAILTRMSDRGNLSLARRPRELKASAL